MLSVPLQHAFVTQFLSGSEHRLALFARSSGIEEHSPELCNGRVDDEADAGSSGADEESSNEDEGGLQEASIVSTSSARHLNGSASHGSLSSGAVAAAHSFKSNANVSDGRGHAVTETRSDPEGIAAFEVFAMDSRHSTGPLFCLNTQIATQWRAAIQHNIRLLTFRTV